MSNLFRSNTNITRSLSQFDAAHGEYGTVINLTSKFGNKAGVNTITFAVDLAHERHIA